MDVVFRMKKARVPTANTDSTVPTNARSTVAIDKRLNGTPQTHPRITGAMNPTIPATMNVGLIG
jgi:hypothetical protein